MSSCLGVLLELHVPDLLAKESKPIALKSVSAFGYRWQNASEYALRRVQGVDLSDCRPPYELPLLCSLQRRQV